MGKQWCRDLPVVTVREAVSPKPITIVLPFYENHQFFAHQVEHWRTLPADLRAHLSAIVVDDGSPEPAHLPTDPPFPIRMFRVEVDVRWNWLAARNIGAHHAPDGWLLLTDMDHLAPEDTLQRLVDGQHDPDTVYAFSRREHTGEAIGPHSASFFMTRRMFWRIGGYDETYSGLYGTDGTYRSRVARVASMSVLRDPLVRFEYFKDSSTTRYLRKQPEDARVSKITRSLPPDHTPKTLSFPYREVTA